MAKGATQKGQLENDINACLALQEQRKEIEAQEKRLRAAIQDQMERADLDRVRTGAGVEAQIYAQDAIDWDADKLIDVLKRKQLDELMPRAPMKSKLKKAMESGAVPGLETCCTISTSPRLKIAPAKE